MTNKINRIIDDAIFFIWIYVIIALPPLAIIYLMKLFSLEADFFLNSTATALDFPTLVAVAILLPALGSALSIWRKRTHPAFFWRLDKHTKIHTLIMSVLLSFILWQFYLVFSNLSYSGLIILILFFLIYIPFATGYLNSINFNLVKVFLIPKKRMPRIHTVERLCYILAVLLILHSLVIVLDGQIRIFNHHQTYISRHPQIYNVKPQIVYYDNKVILTGRGFGWKGLIDTKFKYQEGTINVSLWTDTKVIFTVPLHWKTGDITIWIQRSTEWDGKKVLLNSNEVKLRLISRDDGWDKDDDAYFEQLKHLDKETLKINGYK